MTAPIANRAIASALAGQWARPVAEVVVLDLPLPISTNALHAPTWRGIRNTDRYRTWMRACGNELEMQRPACVPGPYRLTIIVNRRRTGIDLGNAEKGISDLLQRHRVIENDKLCEEITMRWADDAPGCRVIVERHRRVAA